MGTIAGYFRHVKGNAPRLPKPEPRPVEASWLRFPDHHGIGEAGIDNGKGLGKTYRVQLLRDGNQVYAVRFTPLSDPSKVYDVQLAVPQAGEILCDCPDSIYRNHERCKHAQAADQLLAALDEVATISCVPPISDDDLLDEVGF